MTLKQQDIIDSYDILTGNFADECLYLNIGYWKDNPTTLEEACENMASLLGTSANFSAEDSILDVGYGFGKQDIFWMENFQPKQITGINISPLQVRSARKMVEDSGLEDRIDLQEGSATEMPFEDNSFDVVVALESSVHFLPREKFLREAFRVLKPGGRLAAADGLMLGGKVNMLGKTIAKQVFHAMDTPAQNQVTSDDYSRMLKNIGFSKIDILSIRDYVYLPYCRHIARSFRRGKTNWNFNLDPKRLLNPTIAGHDYRMAFVRKLASYLLAVSGMVPFSAMLFPGIINTFVPDYTITVAKKPEESTKE